MKISAQTASSPSIAINQDGRLEVFTNGTSLWHQWEGSAASATVWSTNFSLGGGILGTPTAVSNSDGRVEVFVLGGGNTVYHIWQTTPSGGWSGWSSLGGVSTTQPPSAIETSDGTIALFALQNGIVYTNEEKTPGNSSAWTGWTAIPGANLTTTPSVVLDTNGDLYLFARGADGAAWYNFQLSPNAPGTDGPR